MRVDLSVKSNLIASLSSQLYMTTLGVAVLPLYLKYMGAEAYGLVGFFYMLQIWFTLLDLGLTPTLSRETSRFRAKVVSELDFIRMYRSLSILFGLIAIIGGSALLLSSPFIANKWLKVKSLGLKEVEFCIQNMAVCVALRWMSGLYRGVITGSECLVWLGGFNMVMATLRFLIIIPFMWYFGASPSVFFAYQTLITSIETLGLWFKTKSLKPILPKETKIGWSLAPLKSVYKFSFVIAFTSSAWVLISQIDKFILSSRLNLVEYGYFTLAILIANGILVIISPISTTIMPRLANLEAQGDHEALVQTYRAVTQFVAVVVGSISVTLMVCSKPLLWMWLGDQSLVEDISPILKLYACGNGIFSLVAFPYYLQYAKGDLRLHFLGHLMLLLFFIPLMVWVGVHYGAMGTGYTWILMNLMYLLGWSGVIHRWFEPGLHKKWLFKDIFSVVFTLTGVAIAYGLIPISIQSRFASFIYTSGFIFIALTLSSLSAPFSQKKIKQFLFERRKKIQYVR